jgi:hypothetical protein
MLTNTDAILWYNVGIWGECGYAVPNPSNDPGSLNPNIIDLVDLIGRNVFTIMHHEDADLRIPPSINTCIRVHKLYVRLSQILGARALAPSEPNMESWHVHPAGDMFRVYPIPYFLVRNVFMKRWAGWMFCALSEAMQHTENRKEMEISTNFAGQVGQYAFRVYKNMCTELFGKNAAEVTREFRLTPEDFNSYNPNEFFTSTEMVDTVPRLDRVFTEDKLELLSQGIPISQLPKLEPWPTNLTSYYSTLRTDATISSSSSTSSSGQSGVNIIPPAPGP